MCACACACVCLCVWVRALCAVHLLCAVHVLCVHVLRGCRAVWVPCCVVPCCVGAVLCVVPCCAGLDAAAVSPTVSPTLGARGSPRPRSSGDMQQIGKDKRPPGPSRRSSGDVRGKPQLPKNGKRVIAPSLSSSDLSKLRVPPPPPTAASDRPLQDRLQLVRCVDDLLRLLSSALDRIDDVRCPQPASCSASLIHSRPPGRV